MMLQQIHPDDVAAFGTARATYLDLIEKARAATDQADWDAVNAFEFAQEAKLFDIEQRVYAERDRLAADKRAAAARLDFAVVLGFALQQIGFVVVLLAGLLYRHNRHPEPEPTAA
jgi:hypothetical protein